MHRPHAAAPVMAACSMAFAASPTPSFNFMMPGLRLRSPRVARYPGRVARDNGWAWRGDGMPSQMRPAKHKRRTR